MQCGTILFNRNKVFHLPVGVPPHPRDGSPGLCSRSAPFHTNHSNYSREQRPVESISKLLVKE
jgi:hypothetical protein